MMILIIGSAANMNTKCILEPYYDGYIYVTSSGDQACHMFVLVAIFCLVPSLHIDYTVL